MLNRFKKIGNWILVFSLVLGLCSCSTEKKETKKAKYQIYYVNEDFTGIVSADFEGEEKRGREMVISLVAALRGKTLASKTQRPIFDEVPLNGFDIVEKVLTLDFGEEYYQLSQEKEFLYRAAIVLTLSQVKGVDYVSFSVKGEPLKIDGKIVEAMNENNFSSDLSGEDVVQETDDFTLYFANEKGTALKLYKISKADYSGMTKEEFVVRKLIEGPQKKGYTETLSKAIQLRSVATVDSICYVDFDENFLTEQSVVSNKLVIYSLVNSILDLTDIHKVQITVKGRSDIYYHDEVSLGKPLDRNLDLVK